MTQNTLIKTLAAVAAGLLALACTKPIETQLSLSEKAANFENAANLEKTVKVTCNVDWTVSCTESWVSVSPASGTGDGSFKITVTPNEAFSERTAVVKVVAAEKSAEVQVTQFANVPSVAITPASTDAVAAAGGTVEVTVTSNTDWTVTSSQDWAQVSPASGSKSGKFTVTVAANAAFEERSATITATAQDKTAEITIKQQANVRSLEIAPATANVANAGGTVEVTVTANTNWTVTLPEEAAWLKADVKEGEGNGKVVFTVEANVTDLKGRSANVSFKATGIEKVLAISQDKAAYSHVTDSLALVAIYNAADGANWKAERRWDLSKTIDTFDGVKLTNGRVTQVAVTAAGVISSEWTLPAEVGNLSELAILKFNQCKLTGNIPDEVYGLAKLTDLWLQNNNVTGSLSDKLGQLTSLKNLYLDRNANLGGSIPATIGQLTKLESINISKTGISGTIPAELANCAALKNFMAYETSMVGPLPEIWDKFKNLMVFQIYGTPGFDGPLPTSLGNITTTQKSLSLQMYGCNFTGNIPESYANLPSVCKQFRIQNNKLQGVVPAVIQAHANWKTWTPATYILPQQEGYGLTTE